MRRRRLAGTVALLSLLAGGGLGRAAEPQDVAEARALFQRNLDAIARRDREAYLACYAHSDSLVRTGPAGSELGFLGLEKSAGEAWPDTFEALGLRLAAVRPGVVYGTYRYRVRYGADEHAGLSERLFLKTPAGWRIAVTTAFDAPAGTPAPPRALVGATLVDGTGAPPVTDAVVLVQNGKIECAGARRACPIPLGVATVDLTGQWIMPGLVDAHVHFSQTGWADGRPDSLDVRDRHPYEETMAKARAHPERFFRSYLCSGVTAVFDVGGYAWTLAMSRRADDDTRAPHVAAAGPLLSTVDHWLNLPAERQFIVLKDEDAARQGVRYLKSVGADAVKVWYIVPPGKSADDGAAGVLAAGEEARRLGLPLIVHATGLAEAKVALRAGARLLVHSVWDRTVDDEFVDLLRKGEAVYCPTLTVRRGYVRMYAAAREKRVPAIDDSNGCVDPETAARVAETAELASAVKLDDAGFAAYEARAAEGEAIGAANLKRVQEAGVGVAMGTDAGNPLTLHGTSVHAEMEAMQAAGLTPMQVLVASTRGGSIAMGREKEVGTVEKGKAGDLLVLAADPTADIANVRKLRHVMRGGVLRSIEELRAVAGSGRF